MDKNLKSTNVMESKSNSLRTKEILASFQAVAGTVTSKAEGSVKVEVRRTSGNRASIARYAVAVNCTEHHFGCGRDTAFFLRGLLEMVTAISQS